MNQNPLPRSITATSSVIVATGPHDEGLRMRADGLHYELRRIGPVARNKLATYELAIFDDEELLDKKVRKTKEYTNAVMWAIEEFIYMVKVVNSDRNTA